jgi:hypothetical protein
MLRAYKSICLIEDSPYHDNFKNLIEQSFQTELLYENTLSLPISSSDEHANETVASKCYWQIISNLSKFNSNDRLIVVLDLDLGLDETTIDDCTDEDIGAEYLSYRPEIDDKYIFALFLVKKATENNNIKKCLIYINSSNVPVRIIARIEQILQPLSTDNVFIKRGDGDELSNNTYCLKLLREANDIFDRAYQTIIENLAFDLLDANFTLLISPHNSPHPRQYHEIPRDLYCYSIFTKDDLSVKSYAALFLANDYNRRHIKIESFTNLLNLAGINTKVHLQDIETIQVPIQPGMLFIINLIDFLISMEINEINLAYQKDNQEVDLSFEVREIERFSSAILTGFGRNSSWKFRYLMGCRKDIIYDTREKLKYGTKIIFTSWANKRELTEQVKRSNEEVISNWNPRLLDSREQGKSSIYPALLRWDRDWKSNDNKYIHIKWDSQPCKLDPLTQLKQNDKKELDK